MWKRLLQDAAMIGTVIEDRLDVGAGILCFGASVFAADAWVAAARRGREPYLTARTLRGEVAGPSPILRPADAAGVRRDAG